MDHFQNSGKLLCHTLDDHLISDIVENEQTIKDVKALEIGRQKRGWFNFLGSVAKKVMGCKLLCLIMNYHLTKIMTKT